MCAQMGECLALSVWMAVSAAATAAPIAEQALRHLGREKCRAEEVPTDRCMSEGRQCQLSPWQRHEASFAPASGP